MNISSDRIGDRNEMLKRRKKMTDINEKEKKRMQVYEVLNLPIICRKGEKIIRKDNIIYSGQKYYCKADADMSDLSLGFYEILYKDILKDNSLLKEKGYLINKEFAGDTMNSFNTIKSKCLKGQNTDDEAMWPEYLKSFKESYHCLANFWLLPLEMGRTLRGELNKANRAKDYMDRFLLLIKNKYDTINQEIKREYFVCFESWKTFLSKHYLYNTFVVEKDNETNILQYSNQECQEIINSMRKAISQRAEKISKSDKMEELWIYFNQYGLIKDN